ncbi:DcaP-like protein [Acinetobacter sp. LoGeW2-3]|uniref:DcaP family trimeric outer membrane transporter n=1 Tax=Acinetobacter sp. LoGeW2-3 TaxID=1808001 RepID=UPI000C059328|nr:DcaP family trimeric outer membrane transporter [Acinetobacter sp. LoGeW2-3]ATO20154.1 DcaP-like protein [Acinetobacter sp. LoGeW2-3]
MLFKKIVLAAFIVAASEGVLAEDNLAQEIQVLKEKLEFLEQKSKQQELELSQVQATQQATKPATVAKNIEFKPYGFIRADVAHHFEGADAIFNKISTVPLDSSPNNVNGRTLFNVNASRFGLDINTKVNDQDINGKIEVDFRGGSTQDQLRIRHAYVKVNNWLFGQTTSPFVSADVLPEMVDFMANVGGGIQRNPMIQYQHSFDKNLKSWIALEDGSNSKNTDDQTRLPALTTKTQIKSNDGKSILNFRTLAMQKKTSEDEAFAWGLGLGGIYQLNESNKLHADYYHVKGDSKYMLFANDAYVLDQDKDIVENEYDSLALGLTHNWNAKWRSTLGVGAMLAEDGEYARLKPEANESLYQGWANLFYAPNKSLSYAVEYVYGERKDFLGRQGTDSRLEGMVKYSF